jgi:hypothetical protein
LDEETSRRFDELRQQINDGFECILNRLGSLETDFANTKGFLASDGLLAGRRWLDLEARVAALEARKAS